MSLDHAAVQYALRTRLLTLVVATTGSTSLSATATSYARAAGSFLADGFRIGMEVVGAGFGLAGNNGPHALTSVSALAAGATGLAVDGAAGGRSLVSGLPALVAWDNMAITPVAGRPYVEEEYVPATSDLLTLRAAGGDMQATGLYILRWYGVDKTGMEAISKAASAIEELFKPGTSLPILGSPDWVVRVLRQGPKHGAIRGDTPGWVLAVIEIPWQVFYIN